MRGQRPNCTAAEGGWLKTCGRKYIWRLNGSYQLATRFLFDVQFCSLNFVWEENVHSRLECPSCLQLRIQWNKYICPVNIETSAESRLGASVILGVRILLFFHFRGSFMVSGIHFSDVCVSPSWLFTHFSFVFIVIYCFLAIFYASLGVSSPTSPSRGLGSFFRLRCFMKKYNNNSQQNNIISMWSPSNYILKKLLSKKKHKSLHFVTARWQNWQKIVCVKSTHMHNHQQYTL